MPWCSPDYIRNIDDNVFFSFQAQLAKLCSTYKKSNKADLADDIDKKCSGDLKQMLLAKLGRG